MARPVVLGVEVDPKTRCAHYHSELDVIAIKFVCCDAYYPCYECHLTVADHPPMRRPATRLDEKSVLCGVCGNEMTATEYLASDSLCPNCGVAFNPGCKAHFDIYFERPEK